MDKKKTSQGGRNPKRDEMRKKEKTGKKKQKQAKVTRNTTLFLKPRIEEQEKKN